MIIKIIRRLAFLWIMGYIIFTGYLLKENRLTIDKLNKANNTLLENCVSTPLQPKEKDKYK